MRYFPSPPSVAAGLSGFVIGIILTLILVGTVGRPTVTTSPPATLPPPTPASDNVMYDGIKRLLMRQLGPGYPDQRKPRLVSLSLIPASLGPAPLGYTDRYGEYRTVQIEFRLNDHPLGRVWRLRAAKADVFAMLKALYTSRFPIFNVAMDGLFPLKTVHGKVRLVRSVVVFMDHGTADRIPWRHWGREFEGKAWAELTYRYVDPRFG